VNADGDLTPPENVNLDNFQIVDADNGENVALFVSDSNTDALITYKGNQIIVLRNIVGGTLRARITGSVISKQMGLNQTSA
jgi:mannose/fructose-specific phosphotransferase system component IIA